MADGAILNNPQGPTTQLNLLICKKCLTKIRSVAKLTTEIQKREWI